MTQTAKEQLAAELLRLNPFGGYCKGPCKHPGHTVEHYRETLRRVRSHGRASAAGRTR